MSIINRYIGIDPGKTGAIAAIDKAGQVISVHDWPGDIASAAKIVWSIMPSKVVGAAIERVSARPGQGVSSMFNFGCNYGAWQGILSTLDIPYELPTPQQWRKGLVMPTDGEDSKAGSLAVARRLFPDANLRLKKHHGRAEALLLAHWARLRGPR